MSTTRQRNPMPANNQTETLEYPGLSSFDGVRFSERHGRADFFLVCRSIRLPKNSSKPVIGRQGSPHMPRGSSGMVKPEIAHILFMDTVTRRA